MNRCGSRDAYESTLHYHSLIRKRMQVNGTVVHDDIAWGEGMQRAWRVIQEIEKEHETVLFKLGNKASRGLIFLGEPRTSSIEVIHTDNVVERVARRIKSAIA